MSEESQDLQRGRKPKKTLVDVLQKLKKKNRVVTIIIKSGENCCELTGCIGEVVCGEYVTLISSNNACLRTYIAIDCICAIIDSEDRDRAKKGCN